MSKGDDIDAIIANGISWGRGGASSSSKNDDKVKTKAKKKKYITGAHGTVSSEPTETRSKITLSYKRQGCAADRQVRLHTLDCFCGIRLFVVCRTVLT